MFVMISCLNSFFISSKNEVIIVLIRSLFRSFSPCFLVCQTGSRVLILVHLIYLLFLVGPQPGSPCLNSLFFSVFWTQLYPILRCFSLNLELYASLNGQDFFPEFSLDFQIVFCPFFFLLFCLLSAIERGLTTEIHNRNSGAYEYHK